MSAELALTGKVIALRYLLGDLASTEELRIKLYKNDITPDEDSVTGDFTEATFTGYASILLDDWTRTDASAVHSLCRFTSSADQTAELLYGYYIVRTSTNDLVAAKRFTGAPYSVEFADDSIAVTPTLEVA